MRIVLLVSLISIGSLFSSQTLQAQEDSEYVVVHLKDYDSEKNLQVYSLFKNDQSLEVQNSCDILGLIVLESRSDVALSRNEVRSYSSVRLQELFGQEAFEYVEDLSSYDVLVECREAMQRKFDSDSK